MWVLESLSKVVVGGPFKSEAEMAKKLGVSQQYVNRQLKKYNFLFYLDGKTDFSNSPHHFNKKAYDLKITKRSFQ